MKLQANDVVFHVPSGETWVVCGADNEKGTVIPCGYPFPSMAKISDCKLIAPGVQPQDEEMKSALRKHGLLSYIEPTI